MKVYVVHDTYNVYGVVSDYSRAETVKLTVDKAKAEYPEGNDSETKIVTEELDAPSIGGC